MVSEKALFGAQESQALFEKRRHYLGRWKDLESTLEGRIGNKPHRVSCFGAGGWAALLAGYAPGIWARVKRCVIDGGAPGLFHGKEIVDYTALSDEGPNLVLVGTNPAIQPMIADRLHRDGYSYITWNDVIEI